MKTIHFFGDSWTKGDGCQFIPGSGIIDSKIKYGPDYSAEYNTFSFPSKVKKYLPFDLNIKNNGSSGSSNFQIYKNILQNLRDNKFNKNDIVIVSWTSIIREPLTFMLSPDNIESGLLHISGLDNSLAGHHSINKWIPVSINQLKDDTHKKIFQKIHQDFIVDRLNLNLLYENCMNYICNLQILFDEIGVNYIFTNTFERVVTDEIPFYHKIKKNKWLLFESTLSDYLCDIEDKMDFSSGYSLWEDDFIKPGRNLDGPHPNRIGYDEIAKLFVNKIIEQNDNQEKRMGSQ
jgi:hypothetical protein